MGRQFQNFTFAIDPVVKQNLRAIAARQKCSVSFLIRHILRSTKIGELNRRIDALGKKHSRKKSA